MSVRKTMITTITTAALLWTGNAMASQMGFEHRADFFNYQYNIMTGVEGSLAHRIYEAMKKDPVRAKAALAVMMLVKQ